ncbi:MAG: PadR family transcriptional regulator [Candidatus Hodarchaeales archaeon]|jgi:DNA-binding PadR family transcriptional regulator
MTEESDMGDEKAFDVRSSKAFKRLKSNLSNKTVWMYVLSHLQKHGPTYGYQIKKSLRELYDVELAMVTGYVILYRLEKEKLVTTEANNQGKSQRKYYSITPRGEKLLQVAKEYMAETYQLIFDEEIIN